LLLVLGADTSRLYGTDVVLAFESDDCSGRPYLEAEHGGLLPHSTVWMDRVFVPIPNASARLITPRSVVFVEPDTAVCQDRTTEPAEIAAIPAHQVLDLCEHFTPPFALN
jgi:hypothetical protein